MNRLHKYLVKSNSGVQARLYNWREEIDGHGITRRLATALSFLVHVN